MGEGPCDIMFAVTLSHFTLWYDDLYTFGTLSGSGWFYVSDSNCSNNDHTVLCHFIVNFSMSLSF